MTTPTTATRPTFAQHTARQACQRRAADADARRDTATTNRLAEMYRLNSELQALYTSRLDQQDTNEKVFEWVDDKPAPVALIIERMTAEIERRTTPQASYEFCTEDGICGSDDYQPDLIF
jgi:hypothetical protein